MAFVAEFSKQLDCCGLRDMRDFNGELHVTEKLVVPI